MRFRTEHLPPTFGLAAVDKLVDERRRLEAEHGERHKLAVDAERAFERAEQADTDARAKGIRAGKTATPSSAEKATAALQAAKREEAAYASAVDQVEADLSAALAEHADVLRTKQGALIDGSTQKLRRLVDELEQEISTRAEARAVIAWVEGVQAGGVESRRDPGMSAPPFKVRPARIPIVGPNGEDLPAAAVVQALRAFTEPSARGDGLRRVV